MSTTNFIRYTAEVEHAITSKQPVVALESSIISHGMPYPTNIETALACERIIRECGAMPATVAINDGKIRVGLSVDEIEELGCEKRSKSVVKVSRKDLAYTLAKKLLGGTTVAATMIAAHHAGIKIFATGGIGGVHRGGEQSMDISADLDELARTPVAVVCAGAKSILDIPRTLEVLETKGVPVIGYQTAMMPAFFSRSSGCTIELAVESADEIAQIIAMHWQAVGNTGVLVAKPAPLESAMDEHLIADLIDGAILEASRKKISHKALTPFLLSHIARNSGGQSLTTNIALVKSNAALAAAIAMSYREQLIAQMI